jgi:flavin reductase (DIM6/NTAB) family NADH-FMN oxidoreductase RutF
LLFDGRVSRVDFDPDTHPGGVYRLLTSVVVPRPIAWVSSRSAIGRKDSLANVLATGEFVVNLAPEPLFEEINATATDFPADRDEFAEVGLEREPSALVAPPRVAGSPVAIECLLHDSRDFGSSVVVFGRVVRISIASEAIVDGHPAIERLRPLARLGRRQWASIGEVREIGRIKYEDWRSWPRS